MYRLALLLLIFTAAGQVHAGDVISLNAAKTARLLSVFTGSYEFTYQGSSTVQNAILVVENNEIQQWYECGSMACTSFQLNTEELGREISEPYQDSRGKKGVREISSGLKDGHLFVQQITTVGNQREVERKELKMDGNILSLWIKRDYFRRSFWSQEWHPTLRPAAPESAKNILDLRMYMVKVSDSTPTSMEFRGHVTQSSREREKLNIQPTAKILHFKSKCEDLFSQR